MRPVSIGARVRELLGAAADARHEDSAASRHRRRSRARAAAASRQSAPARMTSALSAKIVDEPQRVDHLHHRVAQRRRRLDDVGGDAAGEVVGEIGHRLAQHIAVRLPADEVGHAGRDRLLRDEIVREAARAAARSASAAAMPRKSRPWSREHVAPGSSGARCRRARRRSAGSTTSISEMTSPIAISATR